MKLLFGSTNVIRGMLFQWLGWAIARLEYKLSTRNALLGSAKSGIRRYSSGNGVWDSGANGYDLVIYEVAPGRTSSSANSGING